MYKRHCIFYLELILLIKNFFVHLTITVAVTSYTAFYTLVVIFIFIIYQTKKLQQFAKLCKGDMSQNSKTAKNGFGATLSRVEFQTGPYKTSHSKYLK